jgi:hypothetical protein
MYTARFLQVCIQHGSYRYVYSKVLTGMYTARYLQVCIQHATYRYVYSTVRIGMYTARYLQLCILNTLIWPKVNWNLHYPAFSYLISIQQFHMSLPHSAIPHVCPTQQLHVVSVLTVFSRTQDKLLQKSLWNLDNE